MPITYGDNFGRWQVIDGPDQDDPNHPKWFCECECGTQKWIRADQLRNGRSTSCGCFMREKATVHGDNRVGNRTKLYRVWTTMLDRCYSLKSHRYHSYGARGIKVCQDWQDYATFKTWALSSGYQDGLTIERVDVDGNYTPENCTWIPVGRQQRNTQKTLWVTAWGEAKALPDWIEDERCSCKYLTVYMRLNKYGWSPEEAIGLPYGARGRVPVSQGALNDEQFHEHFMVTGRAAHPVRAGKTIASTHGPFHAKDEAVQAIADKGLSKARVTYHAPGTMRHD
jgi:hypothetical protein